MKRRDSGFTLIEVLLAALIMGFGLSVLLVGSSRCLRAMKSAQQYQTSQWVMSVGDAEHPFLATNDVESLNVPATTMENGFVYQRSVEDDEDEDDLYVVRTRVTWAERDSNGWDEVVQYVYRPQEAKGRVTP